MALKSIAFVAARLVMAAVAGPLYAQSAMDSAFAEIERRWIAVRYEIKDRDARLAAVNALERDSQALMEAHPDSVDARVWHALVLLAEADIRHNATALGIVKEARRLLEESESQPTSMQSQVYTALGDLYAQVPGWPIAFGSDKKAVAYFVKALAVDPGGLEINYIYADFLAHHGRARDALAHYESAAKAPLRPGHEQGDGYRHKEAEEDLAALRRRLKL